MERKKEAHSIGINDADLAFPSRSSNDVFRVLDIAILCVRGIIIPLLLPFRKLLCSPSSSIVVTRMASVTSVTKDGKDPIIRITGANPFRFCKWMCAIHLCDDSAALTPLFSGSE